MNLAGSALGWEMWRRPSRGCASTLWSPAERPNCCCDNRCTRPYPPPAQRPAGDARRDSGDTRSVTREDLRRDRASSERVCDADAHPGQTNASKCINVTGFKNTCDAGGASLLIHPITSRARTRRSPPRQPFPPSAS